jgi:hypothetical protein
MTLEMLYYYTAHQEEIVEGHIGEFVAIHDRKVLGYYKSRIEGIVATMDKNIAAGSFIVHKCEPVDAPDIFVTNIAY